MYSPAYFLGCPIDRPSNPGMPALQPLTSRAAISLSGCGFFHRSIQTVTWTNCGLGTLTAGRISPKTGSYFTSSARPVGCVQSMMFLSPMTGISAFVPSE